MAFYTATWVRKLVKEDHLRVKEFLDKKDGDFRKYIDASLPFSLYLDLENVKANILSENSAAIQSLAQAVKVDVSVIISILEKAYKTLINAYINNSKFKKMTADELSAALSELNTATSDPSKNIAETINRVFKNTIVVTNVARKDVRVLLIFPSFSTISARFGRDLREAIISSKATDVLSDYIDDDLGDSPRNIFNKFLEGNFGKLQNLGHMEVDVISSGSNEVKRGLVSPRLLQALVALPKGVKAETVARRFSKETGQAETRIVVRKLYNNSLLVLEMLVDSGIMIGAPESQASNLRKAPLEKAFDIGAGLTKAIKADPSILINLETSKSIRQFTGESVLNSLKGKATAPYSSKTTITEKTRISRTRVKIEPDKSLNNPAYTITPGSENSVSLEQLLEAIRARINDTVAQNMGDGNRKDVLNYRTGRFADSVQVTRLTKSREGLITAFYTYMKYPYSTFSAGGMQQYPRSRDPKILIGDSIRNIASTLVKNKFRAVLT